MNTLASRALVLDSHAIVLAGGRGTRLGALTDHRAKPAVPFAGTLRIIDFALANCVNSGLRRIAVLTQYKAQSLIRHVVHSWGFLEASLGEYVDVVPAQQQTGAGWYSGTANAVYQNLELLREIRPRYTLVLGGDHVYKMDYGVMLAEHAARGAALSLACLEVPLETARDCGVMAVDAEERLVAFQEKPASPQGIPGRPGQALVSMGIYAFDTECLIAQLESDAADATSSHDFGHDLIPALLRTQRVFAHRFASSCVRAPGSRPYWRDVGSIDAFWEANLDLTQARPELDLHDARWPMPSRQPHQTAAKFVLDQAGRRGTAIDSLVAGGCIVSGAAVRRSVLSTGVQVDEGSLIVDSVLLPDVRVGRDVQLRRTVIDKRCVLPDGFTAGLDAAHDRRHFHVTERGVTLVTPDMLSRPGRP